ncbi:MAG: hypothetical protein HY293_22285 [Planctomycetes bacterium]|nr:hypothetical protein [Planctomycetota bacterium]
MEHSELFAAIDARPFRPFSVEIVSGRKIDVGHPDNIMILPNRQRVHHIQVHQTDPWGRAIIWPEGPADLLFPAIPPEPGR